MMEIIEGKTYINGLEKSPSICSKAKYALGLKKVKPQNVKTCSAEYWVEVVTASTQGKDRQSQKEQDLFEVNFSIPNNSSVENNGLKRTTDVIQTKK